MDNNSTRLELGNQPARRLLLCLDGLRLSCEICAILYSRVVEKLREFESNQELHVGTNEAACVVADIWSIVDAVRRTRVIVAGTPGLSMKNEAVSEFMKSTELVAELRHYVQHLDRKLNLIEPGSPPLWGIVSWVTANDPLKYLSLVLGNSILSHSYVGMTFDSKERVFLRQVEFVAGTTSLDLNAVIFSVRKLDEHLRTFCESIEFSGGQKYNYDSTHFPLLSVSLRSTGQ